MSNPLLVKSVTLLLVTDLTLWLSKFFLRDRSKLERENLKLHEDNKKLKNQAEKYKKRWQRQVSTVKEKESKTESELFNIKVENISNP